MLRGAYSQWNRFRIKRYQRLHPAPFIDNLSALIDNAGGYRIAAIMPPCQGGDGGSTPPTRSNKNTSQTRGVFVFVENKKYRASRRKLHHASFVRNAVEPFWSERARATPPSFLRCSGAKLRVEHSFLLRAPDFPRASALQSRCW